MLHAAPLILIYGDSLSAAYGLPAGQGWVRLLEQPLQQHKPAIVLLELGANDALRGLPLVQAEKNLADMLKQSRAAGASTLLIGMMLPPN